MQSKFSFMKNLVYTLFLSIIFCSSALASKNQIDDYKHSAWWISIGGKNAISFAVGGRGKHWGFEFGVVADGDYPDEPVLDYPVPHNDYTIIGTYKLPSVGFDMIYYPINKRNYSIGGSIGLYWWEEDEIAQSNATGWLYTQDYKLFTRLAIGLSIDFFKDNKKFMIGLTLHSLRGIAIKIGF